MEDKKRELKKLLYSYSDIDNQIKRKQRDLRDIEQAMEVEYGLKAKVNDGLPGSNKISDPTYETVERIAMIHQRELTYITEELDKLYTMKRLLEELLDTSNLTTLERKVITLRYFEGYPLNRVGREIDYCRRSVQNFQRNALDKLMRIFAPNYLI